MGLVHAYKKGEVPASKVSKAVKDAAKSMKKSSTKKYASTKHTDLPDKVKEERDYKEEYKKYGSSTKAKKYRAELNQYNRKKGTYGNGDGKDASHKGGKIVGFESQSKNRGRAEKSRLKKEAVNEDGHTDVASAERKLKLIVKDAMDTINQLRNMSNEDSLPSWWTDKITLAKDYVSKSRDYITNPAESVNEKTVSIGGKDLMKYLMKRFKMSKSQAIASMKKHKMDMSFLKKESVNEAVEPAGNMAKIQKIVKDSQATKLGGVMIDMQSASLLMKLYDKVSDKDKERMNKFPAKKLTLVIKRLWDRVNLKLPL